MNGSYVLTLSASRDIDGILEYVLEHGGHGPAVRVYEHLLDGCSRIGEMPGIGHTRDDLADDTIRIFAVYSFLILYLPDTRPVQILRVIHGARDMPSALENDSD